MELKKATISNAGESIYRENILDHYKYPHNFVKLENSDLEHHEHNPLCGDDLTFQLKLNGQRVSEVGFSGEGCAICMASASMLSDEIKGKSLEEIKRMNKETVLNLLGVELSPVRLKCAMLSLDTVKNAIHIQEKYKGKARNG
jgi:nitrogen fixation NifU-like protein